MWNCEWTNQTARDCRTGLKLLMLTWQIFFLTDDRNTNTKSCQKYQIFQRQWSWSYFLSDICLRSATWSKKVRRSYLYYLNIILIIYLYYYCILMWSQKVPGRQQQHKGSSKNTFSLLLFFLLHLFKNRLRSSSYHLPVKIARFQKAERLSRFSEKSDKNVKENGNQTLF